MEKITGKEIKIIDVPIEDIDNKYKELGFGMYYGMM